MKKAIDTEIHLSGKKSISAVPAKIIQIFNNDHQQDDPERVQIQLTYNDIAYCGKGTDFMWADAFADLQLQLPDGILICCCMTCRYGSMCPYGNEPGTLYCSKEQRFENKSDLLPYFENTEFTLPQVMSAGYCKSFVCQDSEHYTYNDYRYLIQNKKQNL